MVQYEQFDDDGFKLVNGRKKQDSVLGDFMMATAVKPIKTTSRFQAFTCELMD